MGYETRFYIMQKVIIGTPHALPIAQVDMCCLGQEFYFDKRSIFTEEIDFDLYDKNDEPTREDCYGDVCHYAPLMVFRDWVNKLIESGETYRRWRVLAGLLNAFDPNQWDDNLIVVDYGY